MRRHAHAPEHIHILPDPRLVRIQALVPQTRLQLLRSMQSLPTTEDLLPAHEEIIRVCQPGVFGVGHGVEGAGVDGEFVEDVEIGVVFLSDQGAEGFFLRGGHVLVVCHVFVLGGAFFSEEFLAFGEGEADLLSWGREEEFLGWVDGADEFDFVFLVRFELAEDVEEDSFEHVQDFVVVLIDFHFEIEADELDG